MDLLISDVTLIDGTGAAPGEHMALHIQGDRIHWVGPVTELPAGLHPDRHLSLPGRTVMPGLIDAHVHVCWNGRESILDLLQRDRDDLLLEAVGTLGRILASGTTTVRDIGGHDYMEMALRRAVEAGTIKGPRMRTAGRVLAMTGGHGYFIAREADGPYEFRKAAREQIKAGADTVKLMATGGAATPGQDVQASQLSVEEMRAAVEAAHAMGRTAAAHCHGVQGIRNALLAGMDSIEHGTFLDQETAVMMRERGAALVLTLGVATPDSTTLSPQQQAEIERLRESFAMIDRQVRQAAELARQHGVLVGSGSDAGGNALAPHDFSMALELENLVDVGFSPLEAITIATGNNAGILRWADRLGTLEAGKVADLVVLAADPLTDISHVRQVEAVYKGGVQVAAR